MNKNEYLVTLMDEDITLLQTATGQMIKTGNDVEWAIRVLVENFIGRNVKEKELQRLILYLKIQKEVISNPFKKMKIRRHIAYLEELAPENFIKRLSERIFKLQYIGQITDWEKRYLNAINEIAKTFT